MAGVGFDGGEGDIEGEGAGLENRVDLSDLGLDEGFGGAAHDIDAVESDVELFAVDDLEGADGFDIEGDDDLGFGFDVKEPSGGGHVEVGEGRGCFTVEEGGDGFLVDDGPDLSGLVEVEVEGFDAGLRGSGFELEGGDGETEVEFDVSECGVEGSDPEGFHAGWRVPVEMSFGLL